MTLHTSTGKPTAAQEHRFQLIKLEAGCVCCRLRGLGYCGPEIHHLLDGAHERIGHEATVGLCPWHHRGVPHDGWTVEACRETCGPSLAEGSKPFHEAFGSDDDLLAAQNRLLRQASIFSSPEIPP